MAKASDSKFAAGAVEFRDKAFKSRTIILDNGGTVTVTKSCVTADTPELVDYFDKRNDFERVLAATE